MWICTRYIICPYNSQSFKCTIISFENDYISPLFYLSNIMHVAILDIFHSRGLLSCWTFSKRQRERRKNDSQNKNTNKFLVIIGISIFRAADYNYNILYASSNFNADYQETYWIFDYNKRQNTQYICLPFYHSETFQSHCFFWKLLPSTLCRVVEWMSR